MKSSYRTRRPVEAGRWVASIPETTADVSRILTLLGGAGAIDAAAF